MLSKSLIEHAHQDAVSLSEKIAETELRPTAYDPQNHYLHLTDNPYYDALILLRHYVKQASDDYFSNRVKAKNVDLFMLTPSISSPMGPGSDSEPIPIRFGNYDTYLVDSSQFGFEPLLFQNNDKVYCYLPSMRGEKPDARHLNQFYHCEAEILGTLDELIPIMEGYIVALTQMCDALKPIVSRMSTAPNETQRVISDIIRRGSFQKIQFTEAYDTLSKQEGLTTRTPHGRGITSTGERVLAQENGRPVWIRDFDRDTVAFYQKPSHENPDSVITADLVVPPIIPNGFSGEIIGSGQRQDNPDEMYESLRRQNVDAGPYEWYIALRQQPGYRTTSGFGLGTERFMAWILGYESIRDVILYPRLKDIYTIP